VIEITAEHIKQFRLYFSSTDEIVKREILNNLPLQVADYLKNIETGFNADEGIETIANKINIPDFENELKSLFLLYTSTNSTIIEDETFETDLSIEQFEQEIKYSIAQTERDSLKKKFQLIDKEDELEDHEIKAAITQVEREAIKKKLIEEDNRSNAKVVSFNRFYVYAVAAVVFGVMLIGGYIFYNNKGYDSNQVAVSKPVPKSNKLIIPKILEQEKQLTLLQPQTMGFASTGSAKYSILIQRIKPQIDTLNHLYSLCVAKKDSANIAYLKQQIDSLSMVGNNYSYNIKSKIIHLSLTNNEAVENVLTNNSSAQNDVFLKINNHYYGIQATQFPKALIPVKDKTLIEELDKIIFQNQ